MSPSTESRRELGTIGRHAGTVLAGQLATMAFGLTDTLVAGRYSSEALAGLSVGTALYMSIFVGLQGVLQAQLPIWAHLRGAGQREALGRSVRQALYLAAAACAVGMAVLLNPGAILEATQVPPALRGQVQEYLAILAWALPPALLFRSFGTLSQSLGKPLVVTWVQVGSLAAKVPLSIALVFGVGGIGGIGIEGMGLPGCAWATLIVNYAMLLVAAGLLRGSPAYRPYAIWRRIEAPHWPTLRGFARLGVPTGLSIMVEVTSFTLMALFIARQGTLAAASHQVAASMTGLLYMMPLSLGIAASARVSFWMGAGDLGRARKALRLGLGMAAVLAASSASVVLVLHEAIARAFAGANAPVVAGAAALLPWVALYHVADAVQAVCVFLLRCFGIATATLVVYSLLLWGVGLGGGYLLAYVGIAGWPPLNSPVAFWSAGLFALVLTATAFIVLLRHAARRATVPAGAVTPVPAPPQSAP